MNTKNIFLVCLSALTLVLISCESSSNSPFTASSNGSTFSPTSNSGQSVTASPITIDESSFLIAVHRDEVYVVNPITGESVLLIDTARLDLMPASDVLGTVMVFTAEDNIMRGFNLETREFDWRVDLGEIPRGYNTPSTPVCDDQVCYAVGMAGTLVAANGRTGQTIWFRELSSNPGAVQPASPRSLLVTSNKIYASVDSSVSNKRPLLFVIDKETGSITREVLLRHNTVGVPVLTDSMIIVATEFGLQAFDNQSFEELWRYGSGQSLIYTAPIVVQNTVVFNAMQADGIELDAGQITVGLDIITGTAKWSVDAGKNDRRYMPSTDGATVYSARSISCNGSNDCNANPMAIDPATGRLIWIADSRVQGQPLVAGGRLFYGQLADTEVGFGIGAVDAVTGKTLWIGEPAYGSAPELVHKNMLYRSLQWPDVIP